MSTRPFTSVIAFLLVVVLVAPSAFFIAPQKAHAQLATFDIANYIENTIGAIQSTISAVAAPIQTAAQVSMEINAAILQPLAFVLSGNLMKALTAGVIGFVIGKANGTGAPQFAVDVMQSLQTVGDSQALAYLKQFGTNSNSPFAYSISSALRTNYLQKTSLAGFWAANMCTLARTSPNINGFLEGRWSQGGVAAWFALTTQVQNNPYTLYQNSQSQMAALVGSGAGGATGARLAQLSWGQGFMSWCGPSDTAVDTSKVSCPSGQTLSSDTNTCYSNADGTETGAIPTASSAAGVNPGDPCYSKDGIPGTIKTPGSTIKATLDKVLGGQQDQIVRMGNIGPQINQILGNIATVMQTVQFASQILGGPDSGGLFGVAQSSGTNSTSRLMQYQTSPTLGVTNADVYRSAATMSVSGPDMLARVAQYETSWNTISSAANTASTSVSALINYCNAKVTDSSAIPTNISTQITAAQTALSTEVAPVLARAAAASATIAAARAMVQKLQAELVSTASTTGGAYAADIQTLQTMAPSAVDLASILQDAQVFGTASANPDGSLVVSGGSLVDQMNLISTNAPNLETACNTAARRPTSGN